RPDQPVSRRVCYPFCRKHGRYRAVKRRDFITLLGGAAAVWPLAARAQQPDGARATDWRADGISRERSGRTRPRRCVGLRKLGWPAGRNAQVELRGATPDGTSMQRFACELVALQPSLLLSQNTPTTASVLQQTSSIPVIFATVSDPVGSGFVASLAPQKF